MAKCSKRAQAVAEQKGAASLSSAAASPRRSSGHPSLGVTPRSCASGSAIGSRLPSRLPSARSRGGAVAAPTAAPAAAPAAAAATLGVGGHGEGGGAMPKPKRRSLALERLELMLEQPPHARRAALPNERAARVSGRWHSITARLLSLQYETADGSDWTHLWRSANVLARVGADNPRLIAQLDRAVDPQRSRSLFDSRFDSRPRDVSPSAIVDRARTPFGRVASMSSFEKDSWLNDIEEHRLRCHVMPMLGDVWAGELIDHTQKGAIGKQASRQLTRRQSLDALHRVL